MDKMTKHFIDWMLHPDEGFRKEFVRSALRNYNKKDSRVARDQYVVLLAKQIVVRNDDMARILGVPLPEHQNELELENGNAKNRTSKLR